METSDSESSENSSHFLTIKSLVKTEIKIKNSRFITFAVPVKNKKECQIILSKYQKLYHDASHVCYAYRFGVGDRQLFRYSDAGEPAGTAGAPIYKVIEGADITDLIVLVVRYFGGIKLGVGGLIRAYTEAAKEVLQTARIVKKEIKETVHFEIMYDILNKILHEISVFDIKIIEQNYSDQIEFIVAAPINKVLKFKESLTNISSGSVKFISESKKSHS